MCYGIQGPEMLLNNLTMHKTVLTTNCPIQNVSSTEGEKPCFRYIVSSEGKE